MKVVVMGAGVIGVTTAYYLAKAGAEVTVIDRQAGPGLETSYANAGELSYGMTSPWAAPGVPMKALKWLFMKRRPLFIWPLVSPTMWVWGAKMLMNCNEASYRINKSRMVRVSNYSRDVMPDLIAETGIDYDGRDQGTLQLFRDEKQMKGSRPDQDILAEFGSPFEVLDPEGCIAVEPALREVSGKFVGGLRLLADRTGDCRMFTLALAEKAEELGVTFLYGQTISEIAVENARVIGIDTEIAGRITGDAYVCAMGSYAPRILNPIGIRLPVYPVKGYSVTLPVTDDAFAPQSTIMDETHKVAITRLGDRIRVAGTAEIAGYSGRLGPARDRHGAPCGVRPFPEGRRYRPGRGLDRPAPDDARRHPGAGRHAIPQPVPQYRSRHLGLDDGLRIGPGGRRRGAGQGAGDRLRRADSGAVWVRWG